jgi:hypothetical protein
MAKNLINESVVFEPAVKRTKHRSKKTLDMSRLIVVSCSNGHTVSVKAATFFDKSRKGNKKIHNCKLCGKKLYVEE